MWVAPLIYCAFHILLQLYFCRKVFLRCMLMIIFDIIITTSSLCVPNYNSSFLPEICHTPLHSFKPDNNVTNFPHWASTPCRQTLTTPFDSLSPFSSFLSHTMQVSSCMLMKQQRHKRTHASRQSLIQLSYNCSVEHNFTFHVSQPRQTYLFMIPVQGGADF